MSTQITWLDLATMTDQELARAWRHWDRLASEQARAGATSTSGDQDARAIADRIQSFAGQRFIARILGR